MFGYVTIAAGSLTQEQQDRYRAAYCGLCHELGARYGSVGRLTLSFDSTFLYLLLSSLYEPDEQRGTARCLPHPFKPHPWVRNSLAAYCCDMNIALAYHKCLDDWQDDHSLTGRTEAALLRKDYERIAAFYPEKCQALESCLGQIAGLEKSDSPSLDRLANLTGQMLGALYRYQDDMWADTLQQVGEGLGRFIYLMDAYDDLDRDQRRKRFNPLLPYRDQPDYESFVKESLTLLIAECTNAFETLPLVKDMDILRNILYAGCWSRYEQKRIQRERKQGVPEHTHKEDGV